ncbi:MAG: phosphate ABC transporter permease PstA [Planctomycetes bacterium]|nr:phosphate ABC transporter permease PstA [Planctomycetota bacterium]
MRAEAAARLLFGAMAVLMVIPLLSILLYLFYKGWPILSWQFIADVPRHNMKEGGIWPAILGTIYLIFFSLCASAPIGVLAGIYLNEFARDNWFNRAVNLAVLNLAGVPSIVYALFGVGAFVLAFGFGRSILAASLTLGIMNLPVTIAATKEALSAVPRSFREACWNMGATPWQTIRTIVLPNSLSGILTGVILSVCRAAGETAPILFTGAVFFKPIEGKGLFAYGLFDQCMALSYHLLTVSTQLQGVPEALLYGTALVLICIVLVFNSVAVSIRVYLRSHQRW